MSQKQISAVVTANPEKGINEELSVTFNYDMPDSVEEFVKRYGEAVVLSIINQQTTIKIQAAARTKLTQGKTQEDVQTWANTFQPGLATARKSPAEKAMTATKDMSKEEKLELMKRLKDSMQKDE